MRFLNFIVIIHIGRCSSPLLTGDLSLARYGVQCMGGFHVLFGRTFVFGLSPYGVT